MKRFLATGIVGLLIFTLVGMGWTQEKASSPNPSLWRAGGLVTAVDSSASSLSVHQETVRHDRVLTLKVSPEAAKQLSDIKIGDLVNIWITGNTVTELDKIVM